MKWAWRDMAILDRLRGERVRSFLGALPAKRPWRGGDILDRLRRERILTILAALVVVLFLSSGSMYLFENSQPGSEIAGFGDAVWWSIVTMATVGYGDVVPRTSWGRVVAVATMTACIMIRMIQP